MIIAPVKYKADVEELPTLATLLNASVDDYETLKDIVMRISPVPITFEAINSGANGYFSAGEQRIVIKEGLSQLQTIKTMIHEVAHATLGHGGKEDKIVVDMDSSVKKKLDHVFDKFSDLELFILMKEYGFFGEHVRKLTAKELSYKDFFVELARADRSGGKNIEYGNVKIQRPGRSGGIVEEVLVESVYYVKEKFYSNKVAKIDICLLPNSY